MGSGTPISGSGELVVVTLACTDCDWECDLTLSDLVDDLAGLTACRGVATCTNDYCAPGDVNGDGSVTPGDAQAAFDYYLGIGSEPECVESADICGNYPHGDGYVTPGDAQGIFNMYLGFPNPCE